MQEENLVAMYRKIYKADFKCPPWFSADARRLITNLLDPSPSTRISVAKIVESPWFKKSSVEKPPPLQVMAITKKPEGEEPAKLNAFHLISLSQGFDLSPLFEAGPNREEDIRFATKEPASGIISRLESVAARAEGRMRVTKCSAAGVRLECDESRGRKGKLAVAAEIFTVAPSVLVVEVRKVRGDTLEYRSFCSNELWPALKDIVWAAASDDPSEEEQ